MAPVPVFEDHTFQLNNNFLALPELEVCLWYHRIIGLWTNSWSIVRPTSHYSLPRHCFFGWVPLWDQVQAWLHVDNIFQPDDDLNGAFDYVPTYLRYNNARGSCWLTFMQPQHGEDADPRWQMGLSRFVLLMTWFPWADLVKSNRSENVFMKFEANHIEESLAFIGCTSIGIQCMHHWQG